MTYARHEAREHTVAGPSRLAPPPPRGVTYLGIIAGALTALQAAIYVGVGGFSNSTMAVAGTGLISSGLVLGALGLVESVLLISFAVWLYYQPHHHSLLGIGILTLALLGLLTGGGFWLGSLCGYVAGVLAIRLTPEPRRPPLATSRREAADDPVAEADLFDSA